MIFPLSSKLQLPGIPRVVKRHRGCTLDVAVSSGELLKASRSGDHDVWVFCFCFCFCFCLSRAAPKAYGGSQARGPVGAVAAGPRHSHSHNHSHARSELCL